MVLPTHPRTHHKGCLALIFRHHMPAHVAILGGGLSGLSAAFHLSRRFPSTLITLIEKHTKLGGWAKSDRIQLKDEHGRPCSVLLESGPRTLRPNANSVLELVRTVVVGMLHDLTSSIQG